MGKLTILMITPTPFFEDRGVHVQIYEEARALIKKGHRVVITTYGLGRDLPNLEIHRSFKIPFLRLSIGPSWVKPFILDPLLLLTSLRVAWFLKPDVIHGHLHEGCFIGFFLKIIFNKPLIFDLQGSLTGELKAHGFIRKDGFIFKIFYFLEGLVDKLPDAILTQSSQMVSELNGEFHVPSKKIFLNYDGVDTNIFKSMPKSETLIKSLGIPTDKRIVVYLGIFSKYQGVDTMIEAISFLPKDHGLHFVLMGGPRVDEYQKMAKDLSVDRYITFTGVIPYERANEYLNLGDCGISLKFDDTEANGKLYNYLAVGLPVVATPSRVNKEILGEFGLFAKSFSPQDVAEELNLVAKMKSEDLREIGNRERSLTESKYSWDATAVRIEKAYSSILFQ